MFKEIKHLNKGSYDDSVSWNKEYKYREINNEQRIIEIVEFKIVVTDMKKNKGCDDIFIGDFITLEVKWWGREEINSSGKGTAKALIRGRV